MRPPAVGTCGTLILPRVQRLCGSDQNLPGLLQPVSEPPHDIHHLVQGGDDDGTVYDDSEDVVMLAPM